MMLKPLLKWAGGKSQLIPQIQTHLPDYVYNQDFCLIEPFFGGGAFSFWALENLPHLKKLIINDINQDLICVYKTIQKNPHELIEALNQLQIAYDKLTDLESKKPFYYKKRDLFNQRSQNPIIQASLFIFLNKAGFNGLYRVNKNNEFNVPIGSYKQPKFFDKELILLLSEYFQNITILYGDYSQTLNYLPSDMPCLFYIDPPYRPISDTASFTAYANNEFNDNEQIRLAQFCQKINGLGHQFILSNSDPKNHNANDNFFDDLYIDFCIDRISAKRSISANESGRKSITELLIYNEVIKMNKDFQQFLNGLSQTNATLDYFTDFDKVKRNVSQIELKLNQLNYLLGKQDLKTAVFELYKENQQCFSILEILLAVRQKEKRKTLNTQGEIVALNYYLTSPDLIIEFLEQSGLADVFKDRSIKNLVDYVFGIEVGLDTNARKNRGGDNMSRAVSLIFDNANIFYKKEVRNTIFSDIESLGSDVKQFDFVIKTTQKTYVIEVNYYNGGGSKLNEVARAYSDVAPKINRYTSFEFVWITDGQGWHSAKNKLEEAYKSIPSVYNLATLSNFITQIKSEGVLSDW